MRGRRLSSEKVGKIDDPSAIPRLQCPFSMTFPFESLTLTIILNLKLFLLIATGCLTPPPFSSTASHHDASNAETLHNSRNRLSTQLTTVSNQPHSYQPPQPTNMPQASSEQAQDELPKIDRVVASQPLTRPKTLQMLSDFLNEEQDRRKSLRETHNLHTTWKDLQNAYESVPVFEEVGLVTAEQLEAAKDEVDGLGQLNDVVGQTVGELSKKLALAASPFMGSPDQMALKEQKLKKQRKKKRKDARKEAKKQAKLQAKMMMGNGNRF